MNEQAYLKSYDPKNYPSVLVTVDTVLFTFINFELHVLLVKRNNHPDKNLWGLPGGFVDQVNDRALEDAASRNIKEKTGIYAPYLEQLETIGSAHRDPRGWSVTTVYSALMPHTLCKDHVASVDQAQWLPYTTAVDQELAFDHNVLIKKAFERQRQKALYSFIPAFGIVQPFTITELRKAHEALLGKSIQRKSFARRFESSHVFLDTKQVRNERGRPATLYQAKPELRDFTFVRNLED